MNHSEQISELATSLVAAKNQFKPAVKNANNPHFKSKYVDLAGVIDATEDALLNHGIVVIQGLAGSIEAQSVTVNTRLIHKSGQWIEDSLTLPATNRNNFDPQAVGSAISYGRRYALMAMLGIAAEDDDGNAATAGTSRPQVQPINQQLKASIQHEDDELAFLNDDRPPQEVASLPKSSPYSEGRGPAPVSKPAKGAISEGQVKRLWAIAKQSNRSKDDVLAIVGRAGFNSVEEIGWKAYNGIIEQIQGAA